MVKKANNFNKIARFYDVIGHLIFGNVLKKSQLHFIHKIPPASNILIVGGGTGVFLYELIKNIPCKKVIYIESSSEMINLSRKKIAGIPYTTEIEFIEGNIENVSLHGPFDVIVTHYVLDVFKEEKLKAVMLKLYSSLNPEGLWLFTDFKIQDGSYHKYWQSAIVKIMYVFFRATTHIENNRLLPFGKYFKMLQLEKINSKEFFSGMMETVVYKKSESEFTELKNLQN